MNSTNGQDILEYAIDLGNQYGVGDAERNNGVVMVLALDNISAQRPPRATTAWWWAMDLRQLRAMTFSSLQYQYLEDDFAAGNYDAWA